MHIDCDLMLEYRLNQIGQQLLAADGDSDMPDPSILTASFFFYKFFFGQAIRQIGNGWHHGSHLIRDLEAKHVFTTILASMLPRAWILKAPKQIIDKL